MKRNSPGARRLALGTALLCALATTSAYAKEYLLVWSGDRVLDDGVYGQPDFLAVVDATKDSPTYGQVVNTALMPAIFGEHLLAETENIVDNLAKRLNRQSPAGMGDALDGGLGIPSSTLNEAHHFNAELYTDRANGRKYLYLGGFISSNIFACDVTDPLHIKPVAGTAPSQVHPMRWKGAAPTDNICGLAVSSRAMRYTSAVDDVKQLPNGNLIVSQMGYKGRLNADHSVLGEYTIGRMEGIPQDATRFARSTLTPTLQTPGGLLEFDPRGKVIGEYRAGIPKGAVYPGGPLAGQRIAPPRYRARGYLQEKQPIDTGPEAHPHGIGLRADLVSKSPYAGYFARGGMYPAGSTPQSRPGKGILAISDYADPISLAVSGDTDTHIDQGTTVRFYHLNRLKDGPYAVIQVPDGPRVEGVEQNEEPEGLMAMAMTNLPGHTGMFVASMGGGAIYYSHDITVPRPEFRLVYDFGPGTGPSVFHVSADDRHLVIPKGAMINDHMHDANGPLFNRDYPTEHDREVVVLDIAALTHANHRPLCNAAPALKWLNTGAPQRGSGKPTTVGPNPWVLPRLDQILADGYATQFWPNNGSPDCPVAVSKVKYNTPENFHSMGGPHILVPDREQKRWAVSQYFVDLQRFAVPGVWSLFGIDAFDPFKGKDNTLGFQGDFLPGTTMIGDNTVCMMDFDKRTGRLTADERFADATTNGGTIKRGCISWKRASWPHGKTGHASPHAMVFMRTP
ncbi:MAG TPA: hypothetical protein VGC74_10100 [Stenotrophomonas sp.]|jgi:hypothetical protein